MKDKDKDKEKKKKKSLNKLSTRRKAIPTPDSEVILDREDSYVNDAIFTEKRRTKYKDTVLPPYNAENDPLCKKYFKRKDIKVLLVRTNSSASSIFLPRIDTSRSEMVSIDSVIL